MATSAGGYPRARPDAILPRDIRSRIARDASAGVSSPRQGDPRRRFNSLLRCQLLMSQAPSVSASLPTVSVVIASGAGGDFLYRLLDSLADQVRAEGSEVFVVDRVGEQVTGRLQREYPRVTIVSLSRHPDGRKPSVPELRAAGVDRASGELVAIIEEHCRVPAGWLRAIRESFTPQDAAIGGPILDDAWSRRSDWVVYFSEYHNYLPPWPDGPRRMLNGANTVYRRSLLVKHRDALSRGYWEVELHPKLEREGRMRGLQRLGAHHTGPFRFGYYLRQRFLLARVWGAMQRGQSSTLKRLFYLLFAPLFPFLLLARIASRVRQSGQYRSPFTRILSLLAPTGFVYVAGGLAWMRFRRRQCARGIGVMAGRHRHASV